MGSAPLATLVSLGGITEQLDQALVPIAIGYAVRGTLVLAAAWLLVAALRRRSASARHFVWAGSLVVVGILPVLTQLSPAINMPGQLSGLPIAHLFERSLPEAVVGNDRGQSTARDPVDRRLDDDHTLRGPESGRRSLTSASPDATLLVAVWMTGIAVLLVRLLTGTYLVARRGTAAAAVSDREWQQCLRDVERKLGIRRRVVLRVSGQSSVPITWGVWRPIVMLPRTAHEWASESRHSVLLHELAHVARCDAAIQFIAQLVLAINWFNPLAWYALAQLRAECEQACDDVVLRHGVRPSTYAALLLDLAQSLGTRGGPAFASLAMARTRRIRQRVVSLLDAHRCRGTPGIRTRVLSIGAATPLIAMIAGGRRQATAAAPTIRVAALVVRPSAERSPATAVNSPAPPLRSVGRVQVDTPPHPSASPDSLRSAAREPATPMDSAGTRVLEHVGFTRRQHSAAGRFLTRQDVTARTPASFAELFTTTPGLRVDYSSGYPVLTSSDVPVGGCVSYVVDGEATHFAAPEDVDRLLHLADILAVEVYTSSEAPQPFARKAEPGCEVVVIWTRAQLDR